MNQTTDNQKQLAQYQQQFATLTGQFAVQAKENALKRPRRLLTSVILS